MLLEPIAHNVNAWIAADKIITEGMPTAAS